MLKAQLLEIISNGKSSGVEFKSDNIRLGQLKAEVVTMANLRGSMVLLRFENDGEISGVRRKNLGRRVMNIFNEKMLAGQRSPRNPLLADVMKDLRLCLRPGNGSQNENRPPRESPPRKRTRI